MHGRVFKDVWVSAHGTPKMTYCSPFCRRRFTALDFKSWALWSQSQPFSATFVQKLLIRNFRKFRCKLRHRRSIRRRRFPIRVQNFRAWAMFFVDFCILRAECPPYFNFRFVWPTDLERIPHASTSTSIILTKFEVDMTIHCRVIAFCQLTCYVTWRTWLFDF